MLYSSLNDWINRMNQLEPEFYEPEFMVKLANSASTFFLNLDPLIDHFSRLQLTQVLVTQTLGMYGAANEKK